MSENQRLNELKDFLVRRATESLDFELKEWIDPSTSHGKSKIAKACLALRNNDGGRLAIGFDDSGNQCRNDAPNDIRSRYATDVIQEIVGKYASEPFGISIDYIEIDGVEHPVVNVPGGIENPVICKSELNGDEGKLVLRDNSLYVRSVTSNHRVSSSEIRKGDWNRLLTICFENREADVARFVRRHLVDIFDPQLLKATATHGKSATIRNLLDVGYARFRELSEERQTELPEVLGYREFAVEVVGTGKELVPNISLLQSIANNTPRISGWSPWVILLGSRSEDDRPLVNDGKFESFIDYLSGGLAGAHLDYWSLNPSGEYYHSRALEDDFVFMRQGYEKLAPGTCLDFLLQVSRVAEGIVVAQSISRTLGFDAEASHLIFAARWQGLRGRQLCSWADRSRHFGSWGKASQDSFVHTVNVPLNAAKGDIHEYVRAIIDNLFAVFAGTEVEARVIQSIVNESLDRRL